METIASIVRGLGGLLAYSTLGFILYGVWRGTQRQAGRSTGRAVSWLRNPMFYFITTALYIYICYLGWIPLPLHISTPARLWMLATGSLLYFPGMSVVLWARLALGQNYFVSTGLGAQLFAGHQLVTSGPFAIVRHPMYTGLTFAAAGALLIYTTWTTLLLALFAPLLFNRARREEIALAAEFGERWLEYCSRVPAFFPRLRAASRPPTGL